MNAEKFIKEIRNWDEGRREVITQDEIIELLNDFQNELSKDLESSSRLVMKHLCENCHPHVVVLITPTCAQLLEGRWGTSQILDYVID